ncbi:hypothetical protein CHFL109739_13660 [Chryseobacterium flavum]
MYTFVIMENEICRISIATGWLDDEYIFYENGTIKRKYDNDSQHLNLSEWLKPAQISKQNKDKLIKKCPEELKEYIMQILDYP